MKFLFFWVFLYFSYVFSFAINNTNKLVKVTINSGSEYLIYYVNFSTLEVPNNFKIINNKF